MLLTSQLIEYIYGLWNCRKYHLEFVEIDQKNLLNVGKINYNAFSDVCLSYPSAIDLSAIKSLSIF